MAPLGTGLPGGRLKVSDPLEVLVLLPEVLEALLVAELDVGVGVSKPTGTTITVVTWPPLLKPILITSPLDDSPTISVPLNAWPYGPVCQADISDSGK